MSDVGDLLHRHLLQAAQPPPSLTFFGSGFEAGHEVRLSSAALSGPDVAGASLFHEHAPLRVRAREDHVHAVHRAVHHHLQLQHRAGDLAGADQGLGDQVYHDQEAGLGADEGELQEVAGLPPEQGGGDSPGLLPRPRVHPGEQLLLPAEARALLFAKHPVLWDEAQDGDDQQLVAGGEEEGVVAQGVEGDGLGGQRLGGEPGDLSEGETIFLWWWGAGGTARRGLWKTNKYDMLVV